VREHRAAAASPLLFSLHLLIHAANRAGRLIIGRAQLPVSTLCGPWRASALWNHTEDSIGRGKLPKQEVVNSSRSAIGALVTRPQQVN
jgi:hypothetical protein